MNPPGERDLDITRAELGGLFEDVLAKGMDLRVRVTGESMRPTIESGTTLTISPVKPAELRVGDILVFKGRDAAPVIHRLVDIGRRSGILQTKGDATVMFDEPLDPGNVLGRVTQVGEGAGARRLDTPVRRLASHVFARCTLAKSRLLLAWGRRQM